MSRVGSAASAPTLFACTVVLFLAFGGAAAAQDTANPGMIGCKVSGYDVVLINSGDKPIDPGTEIFWAVPFARREGVHTLTKALDPGGMVFLSGANGSSYLNPRVACEATAGPTASP